MADAEESGLDELGRLDLSGADPSFGAGRGEPGPGSPWDEEVLAGWDPADHLDPWEVPDDDDWPACLPADIRAEVLSRPPADAPPFTDGGRGDVMLPGRFLGGLLADATLDGYCGLSDDELAGLLRACGRQLAYYQALQARAVTEVSERRQAQSRRPGWPGVLEHVQDELAAELTLTGRAAQRMLDVAAGLRRLPAVYEALLTGCIDWARACVFADELAVLDDDAAREITGRLADPAAGWTTGQLRVALRRAVLAADPGAAARRKQQARKDTRVEVWAEGSGNAALAGRELRPSTAILLDRKLTSDAAWLAACGVPGTQDQLRALAYTTLLSGRQLDTIPDDPASWPGTDTDATDVAHDGGRTDPDARTWASAGRAGAGGSIHLIVPVSAWLGGSQPGEVAGHGTVDAQTSRELAAVLAGDPATAWCVTFAGAGGRPVAHACARHGPALGEPVTGWAAGLRARAAVLEHGACGHARASPAYRPPATLAHLVRVRQRTCAFPGCRRAATRCDLDHTVPFDQGGLTCPCNLAPLCRRHHRAKQAPGWHLTQDQPGHMTWRLPSGRTRTTTGEPHSSERGSV